MHVFLSDLAQTVGLLTFIVAFCLVLIHALAPSNAKMFKRASELPLEEDGDNEH